MLKIIKTWTENGAYDFSCSRGIFEFDGQIYLAIDRWCGDGVEGQCYRLFLYRVPAILVEKTLDLLHPPTDDREADSDDNFLFSHELLGELEELGRAAKIGTRYANAIREAMSQRD